MQILEGILIESDFVGLFDQHLDSLFVVQHHLRLDPIFAFGDMAERDQVLGVEPTIGIALQSAR